MGVGPREVDRGSRESRYLRALMGRWREIAICVAALSSACAHGSLRSGGVSLLDDYQRDSGAFALDEIPQDLSGITYNPDSNTHFLVENGAGSLYEYSADLAVQLRKLQLVGGPSRDFEAIEYLGDGYLALAHEQNRVVVVRIPAGNEDGELSVDPLDARVQEFTLPPRAMGNRGFEGLCYDPSGNAGGGTFYALQESSPRRIYRFDRPADAGNRSVEDGTFLFEEPFLSLIHI